MNRFVNVFSWALLFPLIFMLANVRGADLFKYKDDKGRWVFTDKKPQHNNYTQEKMLVTELAQKISVVNRGSSEKPVLYGVNNLAGPAQVWLDMRVNTNIQLHPNKQTEWILDGPRETFLTYVSPIHPDRSWAYEWATHYVEGRPINPQAIDDRALPVPFRGGPYYITQAFLGEASHNQHESSHYAVDIYLPEGTPICAVRSGTVMDIEQDFSRSGWNADVADEANYVRILHSDGSMAIYAHLQPESIQVALGDNISAGQVIANSGNTGYSSGPHLHFAIQYNDNRKLKSWPFEFIGFNRAPKPGDSLTNHTGNR